MNFETFSALKRHIIGWPSRLLVVGSLFLLSACGGGGGASSASGSGTVPTPTLDLLTTSVYINGKPAELLPTYSSGSGSISCTDQTNGTLVKYIGNATSGVPVSFSLASSVNCKLTVLYQDPTTVRTSLLPAVSSSVPIAVHTIDVLEPKVEITANSTSILPNTNVNLTVTVTDNGTLAKINKVWLIPNSSEANAIDLGNTSTSTYTAKLASTTTYSVKLDYFDTRALIDYQKFKYSDALEIKVSSGPGMIALGTPMSGVRSRFTATLLPANSDNISYILVTGGTQDGTKALQTAELYNPKTKEWIPLKNKMAVARFGHVATLLKDGSVLFTGGQSDANGPLLASAEIFSNNVFTKTKTDMAYGRIDHTATLIKSGLQKDKVLIAGGSVSSTTLAQDATVMELFDQDNATTSFSTVKTKLSRPRKGHTASLLKGNFVLFMGNSIPGSSDKYIEMFDTSKSDLTTTDMSEPTINPPNNADPTQAVRWNHTATEDEYLTSVMVIGGYGLNSKKILKFSENATTPDTFDITEVIDLTTNRGGHTSTLLENGDILIAGGDDGRNKIDTIELFVAATEKLTSGLKLNTPRASHISIRLPSTDVSSVLMMGNTQSLTQTPTVTTEIWTSK